MMMALRVPGRHIAVPTHQSSLMTVMVDTPLLLLLLLQELENVTMLQLSLQEAARTCVSSRR